MIPTLRRPWTLLLACAALAAAAPAAAAPEGVPEGYVATPAGWFHPSCVHALPDGAVAHVDGTVSVAGEAIARHDACAYPVVRPQRAGAAGLVPAVNGWVEWIGAGAPAGRYFNAVQGTIRVPLAPTSNGGLIFFFNGVDGQDPVGPNAYILQPVLQWGQAANGQGNWWSLASWFVTGSNQAFYSSSVVVQPHDVISMFTWQSGPTTWNVMAQDQTRNTSVHANFDIGTGRFPPTDALAGVLEAYNVTSCAQYPSDGYILFSSIMADTTDSTSDWNAYTPYNGSWYAVQAASSTTPSCGYNAYTYGSSSSTLYGWMNY